MRDKTKDGQSDTKDDHGSVKDGHENGKSHNGGLRKIMTTKN